MMDDRKEADAELPIGAYSIEAFARSHSIGRSTAYTEIAAGRLVAPAQPRAARPSKPSATPRNWKGPRHEQPYLKRGR